MPSPLMISVQILLTTKTFSEWKVKNNEKETGVAPPLNNEFKVLIPSTVSSFEYYVALIWFLVSRCGQGNRCDQESIGGGKSCEGQHPWMVTSRNIAIHGMTIWWKCGLATWFNKYMLGHFDSKRLQNFNWETIKNRTKYLHSCATKAQIPQIVTLK